MLHISEAGTTAGLFRAARAALRSSSAATPAAAGTGKGKGTGGRLLVYGPFKQHGRFTTDSNRMFDEKLKQMSEESTAHTSASIAAPPAQAAHVRRLLALRCPVCVCVCASRNPAYGLRDIADVSGVGAEFGFRLIETRDMPSNNFFLAFSNEPQPQADATATAAADAAPVVAAL